MSSEIIKLYESYNDKKEEILYNLKKIIIYSGDLLEGNVFYNDKTLDLNFELYTKQLNLFYCGLQAKGRICEVGFNAGNSAMLMLLDIKNTILEFTIFDIGIHKYTLPCLEYISKVFNTVKFEYLIGDSSITMRSWINDNSDHIETYDIVHVDGGHSVESILNDIMYANILVKKNGLIIIDDTNNTNINKVVNLYLSEYSYEEIFIFNTMFYPHRIIKK